MQEWIIKPSVLTTLGARPLKYLATYVGMCDVKFLVGVESPTWCQYSFLCVFILLKITCHFVFVFFTCSLNFSVLQDILRNCPGHGLLEKYPCHVMKNIQSVRVCACVRVRVCTHTTLI